MTPERDDTPRHESVDHKHPTDAGMLDEEEHVPGTGIMGDETLVREIPGGLHLSGPPPHRDHDPAPHPGPTSPSAMDRAEGDAPER